MRINGGSGFGQNATNMPIIADTITITGNSDVHVKASDEELLVPLSSTFGGLRLTQ